MAVVLTEQRMAPPSKMPYTVEVPAVEASDATFNAHVAETLRQWFYRQGIADGDALTDAQLLRRLRLTFATNRRPT